MEEEGGMDQARSARLRKRIAEMQRAQEAETQVRSMLQGVLEPDAYERFMNVRISNPDLYANVAKLLLTLQSNGQLGGKLVSNADLRALLVKLTAKREGSIQISRK